MNRQMIEAPRPTRRWINAVWPLVLGLALLSSTPTAAAVHTVYADALAEGWVDWSWGTRDLGETSPVHSGSRSCSFVPQHWDGLSFHFDGLISGATFDALEFWIDGGTASGQNLRIVFEISGSILADEPLSKYLPAGPQANTWSKVRVAFDENGVETQSFNRITFQDGSGGIQATVFLDDIYFTERPVGPSPTEVKVEIDRNAKRHPINALIYGANWNEGHPIPDGSPPYPIQRWGGNATTRYNWQLDIQNRGRDWFFLNVPNDADVGQLPNGSRADQFVDDARAHGAAPLLTAPLIGWTPKDRQRRPGFSIGKYGPQQYNECTGGGSPPWCNPDAGNGVKPDGTTLVTGNDPADTSRTIAPAFLTDWIRHLAGHGGVRYWCLDNEPALWNSTHRDVHPDPVDYAELWQRTRDYASAMKLEDPSILTLGPVAWGWCEYFYSAKDGCGIGADYVAHGPLLEWYLSQVNDYRQTHHVRLVDYLDIHYYPQASGVTLSDDETAETAARRLRSVKSLYDRTYVDESWIGQPVYLIPRMREIIARKAPPGTGLAITEYNWGGNDGLTSALAQVEVLALFGREGVDLATIWTAPAGGSRLEDAFKIFLNYDGAGGRVSGDSVKATSAAPDDLGAYAVRGGGDQLLLVFINKATDTKTVLGTVSGGINGNLALFGFDGTSRLSAKGSVSTSDGAFTIEMPPRSALLAVGQLAACSTPAPVSGLVVQKEGDRLRLVWSNLSPGTDYMVQEDLSPAGLFLTDTGASTDGSIGLLIPVPIDNRFYLVSARNDCGTGELH